jgi:hypothetical protein
MHHIRFEKQRLSVFALSPVSPQRIISLNLHSFPSYWICFTSTDLQKLSIRLFPVNHWPVTFWELPDVHQTNWFSHEMTKVISTIPCRHRSKLCSQTLFMNFHFPCRWRVWILNLRRASLDYSFGHLSLYANGILGTATDLWVSHSSLVRNFLESINMHFATHSSLKSICIPSSGEILCE